MNISITPFERELLLAHPDTKPLTAQLLVEDGAALNATEDQCCELRDACAEVLKRIGFDESYEPTLEGSALEGLIDKLFVG